jgi:hypothetical protein
MIAADQMYHKADLMDIHDNCHCQVVTVYASTQDRMHDDLSAILHLNQFHQIINKLSEV